VGLSVSWICARGVDRAAAFEALGLVETGEPADIWEAPFSYAERPDGWLTISTTNADWLLPQKVKALSSGGLAVGCFLEEHVMYSGACAYEHGARLWWLTHEPDEGLTHLDSGGDLPAEFERVKAEALQRQEREEPAPMQVDHVFDVPMLLTAKVCGFRADEYPPEAQFFALREINPPRPRGLFGKIAGLFRR
jgi:hypothetical protein